MVTYRLTKNRESPSNQLKIFKQQLVETKVALSSLFIGLYSNVLPWANAFLMVVKEVSLALATMFGIELTDYNSGIASTEGIYDGVEESASNATNAVKELKRQTLGFDEIHNINENTDSDSGSGSVSGGIDQRLLDAIKGYDNGMDSVRMKATEIRDRIMEWLGFTKEVDPLTGQISFEYEGIKKTLKNVWTSFKGLNTQSKIFVGIGLYAVISKLFFGTKNLVTSLGASTGLLGIFKSLLSPTKSLSGLLRDDLAGGVYGLSTSVSDSITMWSRSLTMMDKFKVGLVGILGLSTSMYGMSSAMKSVSEEGWNLGNSLQTAASGLGSIASGAYIGSALLGPLGTILGVATGGVLALTSALAGYENQGYKTAQAISANTEKTNEFSNSLLEQYDVINSNLASELSLTTAHTELITELESLIDSNGKVKAGYEDRAQFIITVLNSAYGTEMEMIGGVITKLDDQVTAIKNVINEKRKEIYLESANEAYKVALDNKIKTYKNLEDATKNYNDAIKEQERYEASLTESWGKYKDSWYKQYGTYENFMEIMAKSEKGYMAIINSVSEAESALDSATQAYDSNTIAIMNYNGLLSSNAQEDAEAVEYWMNQIENTYYNGEQAIKLTYEEQIKDAQEYYNSVIRTAKENGQEITDEVKNQANYRLNYVTQNLKDQCTSVENITPNIVKAWANLGEQNKDVFLENFKQLPADIQTEIVDQMQDKGYNISNELKKGIEQINPEIKIKSSVENATVKIDADVSSAKTKTNNWLSSLFNGIGSFLGFNTKAIGGIYSNGIWKNIPQYANGGLPSHGSMFVAGERGAEIVGNINGRTEVLNQSQIASAIYSAVYSAMSQFNGGGIAEINVHADKGVIVETAVNGIQQHVKQTGELPFTVPIK